MRTKTINSILCKRFDEWVKTIDNPNVADLVRKNTIITGGCIASMLLNEKVNDIDVYFRNFKTAKAVVEYYVAKFKEAHKDRKDRIKVFVDEPKDEDGEPIDEPQRIRVVVRSVGVTAEDKDTPFPGETIADPGEIEDTYEDAIDKALEVDNEEGKPKFRPIFLSTNAITLAGRIQLVHRFYGEPNNIHENYDFVHCTNYWDSKQRKITLNQDALEALLARELKYVGSKYPICSIFRIRKFVQRGWRINAGQILKILMQANELDLEDFKVLEDQLTGVDCSYFMQVLRRVKDKDPEKLDSAYLIEVINRMF